MPAPSYPLINGHRYGYSSVELTVGGQIILGVKEISYKHTLKRGEVRGTSSQKLGRTRGVYTPEASLTMFKLEHQILMASLSTQAAALGIGYMEVPFLVQVNYFDFGQPSLTDRLVGCTVEEEDDSHQEGPEALVIKVPLNVMKIVRNGMQPVGDMSIP